ncbi:MAG: STAS domain-containing protein [Phormidesmis sp. RL_2_1]|nr:STAS domain-containing protein [Phormidesmis sp. RL_2_1]
MEIYSPSVTVIYPAGVLNAESAYRFERQLVSAVSDSHAKELIVDMSRVESLDNAGLVSLMSALNAAKAQGKRLSVCSVPPAIRIVFELTQLDRIFTMVDQVPTAIAA